MSGQGIKYSLSERTGAPLASLSGPWRPEFAKRFASGEYVALEVNDSKGFVGEDLEFLAEVPSLRELHVISGLTSDAGVRHCRNLNTLTLTTASVDPVDFKGFTELREVFLSDLKGKESILELQELRSLYSYNFPYENLANLRSLKALRRLRIGPARRLSSLEGLAEVGGHLEFVGLYHAPRLHSLAQVADLPRLRTLEIYNCRNIEDLSPVARRVELERFLLIDCGEIRSLRPLTACRQLSTLLFYGNTKVRDGDIAVLEELPSLTDVSFQNRRHYNRRREQLAAWHDD